MGEYHRLNFSKLNFSDDTISYNEALENVTPFEFSTNVIFGQKKVKTTKAEKDYGNRCVKLEISC